MMASRIRAVSFLEVASPCFNDTLAATFCQPAVLDNFSISFSFCFYFYLLSYFRALVSSYFLPKNY